MMQTWRKALLRALDALAMLVGFAALLLLLGGESASWRGLLPLLAIPLCLPLSFAPRGARFWLVLALSALTGAVGWMISTADTSSRVIYAIVSALIPLTTLPMLGTPRILGAQLIFLALHLVASLMLRSAEHQAFAPVFTACGCTQLVLLLLYLNRSQLRQQCGGSRDARLTVGNTGMIVALCCAIFGLANIKAIWNALSTAVSAVVRWIVRLITSLLITSAVEESGGGGGDLSDMLAIGESETSPVWTVLEYVAKALLIVLAVYALYRFARIAPKLLRRLLARVNRLIQRYRGAIDADYTDETQSLDDADAQTPSALRAMRRARRRLKRAPDWKRLDTRAQVRAVYRLLRARSTASDSLTARELLTGPLAAPQIADTYDRARYSAHAVTPEEAEVARKALDAPRARA